MVIAVEVGIDQSEPETCGHFIMKWTGACTPKNCFKSNFFSHGVFMMKVLLVAIVFLAAPQTPPAAARTLKLQSYESNTVGFTKDNNDIGYMDFKLSKSTPRTVKVLILQTAALAEDGIIWI